MLGKVLREAREKTGLTQDALGIRARVSRNYISLLERDLKSPTVKILMRIAKALGVQASEIIARVERGR